MPKRFDPTTYNPASNPSLPRTNSVIRFGIAFVLVGFVLMAAALWLPRPVRLSAPEIAYGPDHVTVSSAASNTTNDRIAALIRVRIFSALRPSKVNPQVFQEMDRRDVSVTVGPNSTEKVAVIFPLKAGTFPNHAELEVLSRR